MKCLVALILPRYEIENARFEIDLFCNALQVRDVYQGKTGPAGPNVSQFKCIKIRILRSSKCRVAQFEVLKLLDVQSCDEYLDESLCGSWRYPTDPFINSELQNPSIDVSEIHKIHQPIYFELRL